MFTTKDTKTSIETAAMVSIGTSFIASLINSTNALAKNSRYIENEINKYYKD